jgi:hypothetical protein
LCTRLAALPTLAVTLTGYFVVQGMEHHLIRIRLLCTVSFFC